MQNLKFKVLLYLLVDWIGLVNFGHNALYYDEMLVRAQESNI